MAELPRGVIPHEHSKPGYRARYLTSVAIDDKNSPFYGDLDRGLTATEEAFVVQNMLTDGIYINGSDYFLVSPAGGLTVSVNNGLCNIVGRQCMAMEPAIITFDRPLVAETHIITLQLDTRIATSAFRASKRFGSQPSDLQRNNDIWELGIAQLNLKPGQDVITLSDIDTSLRFNSQWCGIVDYIYRIDTNHYFWQIQSMLNDLRAQMAQQEADWQAQMQRQECEHDKSLETLSNIAGEITTSTWTLINHNWDDISVKYGVYIMPVNGNVFHEEMRFKANNALIATCKTFFYKEGETQYCREEYEWYESTNTVAGNAFITRPAFYEVITNLVTLREDINCRGYC